ncbi:MAG: DUF692 domain-containing protein [Gammaproteobacteria bacterium]|nr:DUF692 domain-containing protein [Gammaproteobacteria bacterium]
MHAPRRFPVHGAGLGLRRALMGPLADHPAPPVDFFEVAPENWIGVGGRFGRQFRRFTERYPFVTHGLSLSLGGPAPLDEDFLHRLKRFLDEHGIRACTEHLSYCSDDGQLYDLLPIPFTAEAVRYVAARIRRTQDILERRIAVENVSYYAAPGRELSELEFIDAVLAEADCDLLLDVNNVYVNSVNHGYNAHAFLAGLPAERILYLHVAGHHRKDPDLLIDTHGADVVDPVWTLLDETYARFGVIPTLLERDFDLPPLAQLLGEVQRIAGLQAQRSAAGRTERHG